MFANIAPRVYTLEGEYCTKCFAPQIPSKQLMKFIFDDGHHGTSAIPSDSHPFPSIPIHSHRDSPKAAHQSRSWWQPSQTLHVYNYCASALLQVHTQSTVQGGSWREKSALYRVATFPQRVPRGNYEEMPRTVYIQYVIFA